MAHKAAAAAAFVGDLTIFEGSRASGELLELARPVHCGEIAAVLPCLGRDWPRGTWSLSYGYCHYTRNKRARRLRPEITGPEEAVDVPRRFSGVWRRRMGQIRLCTFLLKLRVI